MTQLTICYQCHACSTLHREEADAVKCCRPCCVTAFACSNCHELFMSVQRANRCCRKECRAKEVESCICSKCRGFFLTSAINVKYPYVCPNCVVATK